MSITIPSTPEISLTAVKAQLTIRVLDCNRGGFVVISDNGMAARSSWDEVLDSINEIGEEVLKVERLKMPRHMAPRDEVADGPGPMDRLFEAGRSTLNGLAAALTAIASSMLAFASVKIA